MQPPAGHDASGAQPPPQNGPGPNHRNPSVTTAGSGEVLYEGPAQHTVVLGRYLVWSVVTVALSAGGAVAMAKLDAIADWPLYLLGLVGVVGLLVTYLRHVTTRFKVSRQRIELERGVLGKDLDSLELWRVLDLRFKQTVLDRILGNARIIVVSTDQTHPELVLHGLPGPRILFEQLREAVHAARQTGRPMELVGQDGRGEWLG